MRDWGGRPEMLATEMQDRNFLENKFVQIYDRLLQMTGCAGKAKWKVKRLIADTLVMVIQQGERCRQCRRTCAEQYGQRLSLVVMRCIYTGDMARQR
jgi:hypothetical protein